MPPGPSLSGSALELWGSHLVQHSQPRPMAIASSAVSLRGGLQGSSSSLPSDVFSEPLFFNRQISQPAASSAIPNTACPAAAFLTSQQEPLALSAGITGAHLRRTYGLHCSFSNLRCWHSSRVESSQVESSRVLLASSMARCRQLSPSNHLVSGSLSLRQTTHSRCSDRPAPHR